MQIHNGHTFFLGASFPGIFFENIFRISGLNSFQQSEISRPFSRFIIDFDVISFPGLRQSIKSISFIFLFLQCVSDSKNILLPQSILCFVVWTCSAIPFVLCLRFTAYSCWYFLEEYNCCVSPT